MIARQLGLDGGEHAQHVIGAFLQLKRLVAHLQTVEDGRHGAGTGNVDVIVAAQGLDKPGATDDLGVQSLKRHEHDAKVGRCRHTQVLFADVLGLALDHGVERLARSRHGLRIARLLRVEQVLVRVARKLGVNRQQRGVALVHRQLDGKLNALRGAGLGGDVFQILVGRKDVRQNCTQLYLAQNATRLHVTQHALKVAHAGGDGLHVAQTLVHGLELVAHLLKRCRQAVVERAGEFLVHRRAHLIELHVVVLADGAQLGIDRLAHLVQAMLDALAVGAELLGRLAAQVIHPVTSLRKLACDGQVTLLLHGRIGRLLLRDDIGRAAGFGQRDVQGIERAVGLLERRERFRATVATLPQLGTQALELEGASHSNPHRHQGDHNKHSINSRHKLRPTNSIGHQSKPRSILPRHTHRAPGPFLGAPLLRIFHNAARRFPAHL